MFACARPWGRLFHPGSLGSGGWVHSGAPWGSLNSSVVVGFTRVCSVGNWFRFVHSGISWGSFVSFWVVGCIRARPGCC